MQDNRAPVRPVAYFPLGGIEERLAAWEARARDLAALADRLLIAAEDPSSFWAAAREALEELDRRRACVNNDHHGEFRQGWLEDGFREFVGDDGVFALCPECIAEMERAA